MPRIKQSEGSAAAASKLTNALSAVESSIAYRHPETGDTWSGKGKQPAWIKHELQDGAELSEFEVSPAALVADVPPSSEFAEQLQVINLYTDPALNVAELIDLDLIDDSPFQPRTFYPEGFIQGLGESMKAVGMLQPMVVRPKPDGRYENVFGHCRKRGAKLGGLTKGPCFVRELTDAESAQLQAVENLQREKLDAFDEAQSFAAYIKAHNCSKDEFCRRTGLSRTQVYNRLKLSTLHPDGVKALRDKRIRAEVATLIARVPSEKHQAHALKLILDNSTHDANAAEEALMTVRKARDMIREKFTLGLKGVIWSLDDATLVESAGACTVCPKRSGVDPILYIDLFGKEHTYSSRPSGENVCTDPACFDIKKTAQLKANQAVLEAKGKTVIAGGKARQAISATGEIKAGYIAAAGMKDAIKKAAAAGKAAPVVMTLQDPRNGKTVEVVKVDELKAAGIKAPEPKASGSDASYWAKQRAQQERDRIKSEERAATNMAVLAAVREAAAKAPRSTLELQLIAHVTWSGVGYNEKNSLCTLYDKSRDDIVKSIGSMAPDALALFMLDCALVDNITSTYQADKPEAMLTMAKHYGIDVEGIRKAHLAAKNKADAAAAAEAEPAKGKKPTATKAAKGKGKTTKPAEDDSDVDYPPGEAEELETEEAEA